MFSKRTIQTVLCLLLLAATLVQPVYFGDVQAQVPIALTKLSPANGSTIPLRTSTYQLLLWSDAWIASTDRYQYCIDETNNSQCDNNNWVTRNSIYSGGPGEFPLLAGHTYYWQVRVRDIGTVADNGTWWSFTVQSPVVFNKTLPANGAVVPMPTNTYQFLQWTDGGKAISDKYQYCIDETNNAQCDSEQGWVSRDSLYSGGPGEFTLLEGKTYYWQVQLRDTVSLVDNGAWWSFTVIPPNPAVVRITRAVNNPVSAASVDFNVTFTEDVTGVDVTDFQINTNLSGTSVQAVNGSGSIYTVTVATGTGNGNLRLDLIDDDSITNSLSAPLGGTDPSNGNFSSGEVYVVDKSAPSVTSITRAGANPTNATSVNFNVTFSKPVTGVDLTDFGLSTSAGATLSAISGSGANYAVTVTTGSGVDTLRLDFTDNDSVIDSAGNPTSAGFTSGESYTVDRTSPTVLSITQASQPNVSKVDFTVSFSESVTGVDGSDFSLSTQRGAVITGVSGSGSQYTVSISLQPGSDTLQLNVVDNDSVVDSAGNPLGGSGQGNGNFASGSINITVNVPIVTSIIRASSNPTNAASVDFIVTFSETVSGVDAGDFQVTGGGVTAINNQNPFYIVTVTPSINNGLVKLDLIDNDSIQNGGLVALGGTGAGNANFLSGESFTIDRTPPLVTSIIRASGNPTLNPTADFIVTFSESVIGVESNDFTVTQTNVIKSSVTNLQNADPFYWVTVRTGAGSGTIRLDLNDSGNLTDRAGNALGNNHYTGGESFTIAKTPIDFSAPVINKPSAPLLNSGTAITWSSVPTAQAYEYFIARDSVFSQIVAMQTVPETTQQVQSPLLDGTYYLRIRAYNANLSPGKFSETYSFTIDVSPPATPIPLVPKNNTTATKRPWLRWSVISDGKQYQVEVDNDSDFSSPVFSAATTSTSIQTNSLPRKTYYWRVRVKDSAGNWSAWSSTSSFIVP